MTATRSLQAWLEHIELLHPKTIEMGLERVREVSTRLGLTRPAAHVITVAGTNGKGSTVAFVEAIARRAGWKVGAYTSPHLLAYNERVRIDGALASDSDLVAAFEAIAAARGDVPLTYFEYGTLAALWLFERAGLDLAILEVGLGGRLDATNIVDPDVAVITTVDVDHQDYLGPDRETIGVEKAGIARAWKPLVIGDDDPAASVLVHAYAIGASAIRIGCDFFFDVLPAPDDHGSDAPPTGAAASPAGWHWREVGYRIDLPLPRLAAPVQLRNAAIAIAALRALGEPLDDAAVVEGVASADLPGRLQRFDRDGVEYVVDVGHNPQAAAALAVWLRTAPVVPQPAAAPGRAEQAHKVTPLERTQQEPSQQERADAGTRPAAGQTHAVYAALVDKDVVGVVAQLADLVDDWHVAGLAEWAPRGVDADTFARRLEGTAAAGAQRHADVAAALQAARTQARAGDRVLVFGSFHTAAAALAWLEASPSRPG